MSEEQALVIAQKKLVKVAYETPQATVIFEKITEIISQPAQDYKGMIVNPFMEEFHEAMAPIYSATAPIMEDIYTMLFKIAQPFIMLGFTIIEKAGPLIIALRNLLMGAPVQETETISIDPNDHRFNRPPNREALI